MVAAGPINQLRGHADPISNLAQAAFEDVARTELTTDLLHVDRAALVDKARIAGDDVEPFDPRQPGDDVFDNAVDEIFLLGITAHVLEWQDLDRGPVGQR